MAASNGFGHQVWRWLRYRNVYTHVRQVPGLTDAQRDTVCREVHRRMQRQWRFQVAAGFFGFFSGMWIFVPVYLALFTNVGVHPAILLGIGAACWGASIVAMVRFAERVVRRTTNEVLQTQGIRICEQCRYDLRGQVEPRCPECGRPFER